MESSPTTSAIFTAFVAAQAEFSNAKKESTNPHFKSRYADLSSVMEAIKGALALNGLAFIQRCRHDERNAIVETVIIHASGEWISGGEVSVPCPKLDPQGYGSALTYARRYSLSALMGVGTEDDDANAAQAHYNGPAANYSPAKPATATPPPMVYSTDPKTAAKQKAVTKAIDALPPDQQDKLLAWAKVRYKTNNESAITDGEILREYHAAAVAALNPSEEDPFLGA